MSETVPGYRRRRRSPACEFRHYEEQLQSETVTTGRIRHSRRGHNGCVRGVRLEQARSVTQLEGEIAANYIEGSCSRHHHYLDGDTSISTRWPRLPVSELPARTATFGVQPSRTP
jgi:hypothetical protein